MNLKMQDFYALRRTISKLDVPADLKLSPFVAALLSQLDCANNESHRKFIETAVCADPELQKQVLYLDPLAPPPPAEEDDHAYIETYIQQVTTQANAPAPDTSRTNGSSGLLVKLHELNQQGGPQAAQQGLEAEHLPVQHFDRFLGAEPVRYLDKERVIQAEELTAIVGQPGAGKSFWALRKLAELGDTTQVLYVAAEGLNPERLYALKEARAKDGIPHTEAFSENFRIYNASVDLTTDAGIELFLYHLRDFKPKVVVFDTFAACTPGIDENSSKDVQPVLNNIRERIIKQLGCAVLLIHHTTKDGKSFRGSSALRGNVANMYYLIQDDDIITLRSDKQRDSEPDEDRHYRLVKFATRLHPDTDEQLYSAAIIPAERVVADPEEPKLTRNQRAILEALEPFENGLLGRSLEDATGIAKSTLWRNIGKLAKMGYIRTGEKGEPIYITESGREMLSDN